MAMSQGIEGREYLIQILIFLLIFNVTKTFAQGVLYCSSQNTGSSSQDGIQSIVLLWKSHLLTSLILRVEYMAIQWSLLRYL